MAIEFNVAGDMVRLLPGDNEVDNGAITIAGKFKRLADRGAISPLFALYDATGNKMAGLVTAADGDSVRVWADWAEASATNVGTLVNDEWFDAAFVGDDSSGSLKYRGYIQRPGAALGVVEVDGVVGSGWFSQIVVGNRYDGYFFDGRATEVRIWRAALSAVELAAEFLSATPVRTGQLVCAADFTGASLAVALVSSVSGDTWTGTWETDGSTPTVDADAPTYSSVPTLTGSSVLPAVQLTGSVPGAPTLIAADVQSTTSILVSYSAGTGTITGFRVYATRTGGPREIIGTGGSAVTSILCANLATNAAYLIDVVAYNDAGESPASAQVWATTLKWTVSIPKVEKTSAGVTGIKVIVWGMPSVGSGYLIGSKIAEVDTGVASAAVFDSTEGDSVCTITADIFPTSPDSITNGQAVMAYAAKDSVNRVVRITSATVVQSS